MFNHQFEDENGDIQDLLLRYQNLKTGKAPSYIEEDDFEKIIAHLDEKDGPQYEHLKLQTLLKLTSR